MEVPRLFYAPPGADPVPVSGRVWVHPRTKQQTHNPKVDIDADLLPLDFLVTEPDGRAYLSTPSYSRSPNGQAVRMAWSTQVRPITPVFQQRVQELKELSARMAVTLPAGFNSTSLLAAYAHSIDALAGGSGPYDLPKEDGTWQQLSKAQLSAAMSAVSNRIEAAATTARAHYSALVALRDAGNIVGLHEYDLTTGWPT